MPMNPISALAELHERRERLGISIAALRRAAREARSMRSGEG
jgi:hypothetical protein